MMDGQKADLRIKIDGKILIYRNAIITSDEKDFLTFTDNKDGRSKTYSKSVIISMEVI